MITVNSWDDLLERGVESLLGLVDPGQMVFGEGLVFEIKIHGESWAEAIDYRGAKFVIELQEAINRAYCQLAEVEKAPGDLNKHLTVRMRIEGGSSIFKIDWSAALQTMIERMPDKSIPILAGLVILCITGHYTYDRVLTHKEKLAQIQAEKEVKIAERQDQSASEKRMAKIVHKAMEVIEQVDAEKPARSLVGNLEPDDTITFHGGPPLAASEAKQRYPRKPRTQRRSGTFDADYQIKAIDFDKAPVVFRLYKDGLEFLAKAELAEADIDRLSQGFRNALLGGSHFDAPLQVFIIYNDRRIISASVTGIGEARDTSGDIQTLVQLL